MTVSLLPTGNRHTIRIERRLRHAPDRVWRAVTEPAHLSAWYPFKARSIDLRVGGTIDFDDGEGGTMLATIKELDPPRRFAFSEHAPDSMPRESDDLVVIDIEPDGTGTLLVFSHTFDDRQAAASYATGWIGCLHQLEAHLNGNDAPVEQDWVNEYERWHAEFGLDRGRIEDNGQTLRFDRQLMRQPRAHGWNVITGGAALRAGDPVPVPLVQNASIVPVIAELSLQESISYTLPDGSIVTWHFGDGPGGIRIGLTVSGKDVGITHDHWRDSVETLARAIIETPREAAD